MKKLFTLFAALGLVLSLAACGGSNTTSTTDSTTTTDSSSATDSSSTTDSTTTESLFSGNIAVYTRDTSSGTRAGFMGKIGFEEAESDDSVLVDGFIIQGNSEIIAAVQADEYAIGYVSLSTLDTSLFNGLSFETVVPTTESVLDGSYKLARKFNYMLRDDYSIYGADADRIEEISNAFVAYMGTLEGKATIAQKGGIVDLTTGESWDDIASDFGVCSEDNSDLTIKFGGSDSVEKIATGLSPDFAAKCGDFVPEHNHTGSSNAWKGLNGGNSSIDDALSIMIGFASREFYPTEVANTTGVVAIDAIVAVTNLDNPIENMSAADLKAIYSGEVTDWSYFAERQAFDGDIAVYTRDTSSGTRAGFMGKIGFEEAEADDSVLVDGFIIQGNSEIIAAVQQDVYAIGYVSLSTLDTNLFKGLAFEGVEPTEATVLDGTYLLARNFNYMLRDDYSIYGADADRIEEISNAFVAYMGTLEGKATIAQKGGIVDLTTGESWDDIASDFGVCSEDNSDLTIKFGGSDSVEKIATGLSPDFAAKCGDFVPEHNHTGSSNAWKGLIGGNSSIDDALSIMIGFASREFKDSEVANTTGVVAIDAIVAIVNLDNPYNNMTAAELRRIYAGDVTNWADFQ